MSHKCLNFEFDMSLRNLTDKPSEIMISIKCGTKMQDLIYNLIRTEKRFFL